MADFVKGVNQEFDKRPSVDVKLFFPVVIAGAQVDKLTIRRPTLRDMKKMASYRGDDLEKNVLILADLTGNAPTDLDVLDAADIAQLTAQLEAFQPRPVVS